MITDPLPISFTTLSETKKMWHLTPEMWHMGGGVFIFSKFQLPSSYGLGVILFWRFGEKGLLNKWMNQSVTPGLLKSCPWFVFVIVKYFFLMLEAQTSPCHIIYSVFLDLLLYMDNILSINKFKIGRFLFFFSPNQSGWI